MDADSRPQEGLRRHLLRRLVLEVPDAVAVRQRLEVHAALGLDADLEPALARRVDAPMIMMTPSTRTSTSENVRKRR